MALFKIFDLLDRFLPNCILEPLTIRANVAHYFLELGVGINETKPFSLLFILLRDFVKQIIVISLVLGLTSIKVHSEFLGKASFLFEFVVGFNFFLSFLVENLFGFFFIVSETRRDRVREISRGKALVRMSAMHPRDPCPLSTHYALCA